MTSTRAPGCQWPMWSNAERAPYPPRFCNAPRAIRHGTPCPYCATHAAVAYLPPRASRPSPGTTTQPPAVEPLAGIVEAAA